MAVLFLVAAMVWVLVAVMVLAVLFLAVLF